MYVTRISDDPQRFEPGSRLLHEDDRVLVVEHSRVHRNRFLVKFEGFGSREDAETLRGALYTPRDEVRDLDEDEFWEHDIVGAEVRTADGEVVGRVTGVDAGPGQDRLVIATESGERMIPLVQEFVVEVNADAGRVVVDPPEGLLE